ncbi:helix-turn-helix domain-containing protein [Saliphagus sp. LR7]|uniref:helix-turn-helix domain-containing protein n=1 Tax=Saliphagus sp. LR7 TaxID=2282654 RepID=UPI000DF77D1D|nr:helix-turn-helix domain-containing protein [Saliphagus sp. LR7]
MVTTVLDLLTVEESTITSAHATSGGWTLRLLFPTREAVSQTHDHYQDHGIGFEIHRVYAIKEDRNGRFGLTENQYEMMIAAFDGGYYDIPRGAALEELANEFDVSHQAASECLRRAHTSLVENTIALP